MHGVRLIRSRLATLLMLAGLAVTPATAHAQTGPAGGDRPSGGAVSGLASQPTYKRVCPQPPEPDRVACQAMVRTDLPRLQSLSPDVNPPGYGPRDIRSAYDLNGRHGHGRTVAITVAFHNPNLESDLAVYRRQFHLPPCTTASGCLRVINQRGGTTPPSGTDSGWAAESALDVDAVSATCPDCRILVVEADDANFANQLAGVDQAVAQGAKFVSGSWGASEFAIETTLDHHFSDNPGVAFTFGAGDSGYGTFYPAASPYVTAVGGTSLHPGPTTAAAGARVSGPAPDPAAPCMSPSRPSSTTRCAPTAP